MLLLAVAAGGCTSESETQQRHGVLPRTGRSLLLITTDTTRADHLEPYGAKDVETPTLARLAQEGIVCERAYAVAPITLPAHTSILTGLYPPQHGVRNNGTHYLPDEVTTLAERLRARGLRTAAFVSAAVLERRYGLHQGFEVYDDDLSAGRERHPRMVPDRPGEATVAAASNWLNGLQSNENFFLWVHFYDPHALYSPPPPYRDRYRERLYDGEIAYMDAQIGRLLDHPRLARDPNLIVMVIGDHGESLGEHGEQTHAILAYDATLHVPWIMKLPSGPRGARIGRPVSQVDLVPTVLDLLQMDRDQTLPGRSLLAVLEGTDNARQIPLYAETYLPFYTYGWAKLRVVREGDWKFIDAPVPELYDLHRDPRELSNLFQQQPGVAHDLQRDLRQFTAADGSAEREAKLQLDAAAAERLRILGYLPEGSGATRAENDRPDPKRVIGVHVALERAHSLLDDRLYKDAEQQIDGILREDPNNLAAMLDLVDALDGQQRTDDAVAVVQRALALDPNYARLHLLLASLEEKRGHRDEALKQVDAALALDTHGPEARIQKALLLQRAGKEREAEAALREALDLYPDDPRLNAVAAQVLDARHKEYAAAEARLRKALARDPFLVLGWRGLGTLQEHTGRPAEAIESYTQGLQRAPEDAELHLRLGILLARRGGGTDAESHLREAIRLDPEFRPEAHVALGAWLAEQGRLTEAQKEYAEVLKVEPENSGALNNRAIALYRSGKIKQAEAELNSLVKRYPKEADPHNNLAAIALDRGEWHRAETHAREAIKLSPELTEAWSNLGIALGGQGRFKDAEEAFRHAIALDPEYWEARNNLATTLRKEHRWQEAAALFNEVLRQMPDEPEVHLELGDLYAGPLKDPALARAHYNAFLRRAPRDRRAAGVRQRVMRLPKLQTGAATVGTKSATAR
jgi:arylsulfatase A-like enzyme/Flp pilus assembly protein TadD